MAGTNPRAARIAALIQRVIASSMEAQLHDKRLANVTITECASPTICRSRSLLDPARP